MGNFSRGKWDELLIDSGNVLLGHLEGWGKSCLQVIVMVLDIQFRQLEKAEKLVWDLHFLALKEGVEEWDTKINTQVKKFW